jgi:mannose-6-phosphate isomerase-like protein (cupin superfamily)
VIDSEISSDQVKSDRFPFPSQGDITLAVRNANYTLGPVMLHLAMEPGSTIPSHVHEKVAEVLYIVEGDFINEGKTYGAGTTLHIKAGMPHGPHSTRNGCKLLVLWTERSAHENADLSDFALAAKAAA